MENSSNVYTKNMLKNYDSGSENKTQLMSYNELKSCIKQHQLLINYMDQIETLYCYIMMGQGLGAVLQICFSGFQIILVRS